MKMKTKNFPLTTFLLTLLALAVALPLNAQVKKPKASLTLTFTSEGGTNASAVVYNPENRLYYAGIAGNVSFPLEVFDTKGVNKMESETGVDLRGMWWDPKSEMLLSSTYGGDGIMSIGLDSDGMPSEDREEVMKLVGGLPNDNACGTYYAKKKEVIFYDQGNIYAFKTKKEGEAKMLTLDVPVPLSDINSTTAICTDMKKMEIGLLDFVSKKVYLFNRKKGNLTATITLPSDAVTHDRFRFAYANGHIFLYDTYSRAWTGYKIF
jgi:hypothetical protein